MVCRTTGELNRVHNSLVNYVYTIAKGAIIRNSIRMSRKVSCTHFCAADVGRFTRLPSISVTPGKAVLIVSP